MLTAEFFGHKYNLLVPFKNESMHAMFLCVFFFSIICVRYGIVCVKIESGTHILASIGSHCSFVYAQYIFTEFDMHVFIGILPFLNIDEVYLIYQYVYLKKL